MFQKLEHGKLRPQTPEKHRLSGVLETRTSAKLRVLSKVRTDWPDHSQTNHFDNENPSETKPKINRIQFNQLVELLFD